MCLANTDGDCELRLANTTEETTATRGRSSRTAEGPDDLGYLFACLTAAAAEASRMSIECHELSPLDYGVLDRCHRGEANTVTELARAFPVDASVMSRQVSKLVDRGLISRKRPSSDRRTVRLRLAEGGRSLAQSLAEELSERQGLLMKGVSDDVAGCLHGYRSQDTGEPGRYGIYPPPPPEPPEFGGREIGPAIGIPDCGVINERIGNG